MEKSISKRVEREFDDLWFYVHELNLAFLSLKERMDDYELSKRLYSIEKRLDKIEEQLRGFDRRGTKKA